MHKESTAFCYRDPHSTLNLNVRLIFSLPHDALRSFTLKLICLTCFSVFCLLFGNKINSLVVWRRFCVWGSAARGNTSFLQEKRDCSVTQFPHRVVEWILFRASFHRRASRGRLNALPIRSTAVQINAIFRWSDRFRFHGALAHPTPPRP